MMRVRDLIVPGCDRTSPLPRGAILAACWLHVPQPKVDNQAMGVGFPYLAGRCRLE